MAPALSFCHDSYLWLRQARIIPEQGIIWVCQMSEECLVCRENIRDQHVDKELKAYLPAVEGNLSNAKRPR